MENLGEFVINHWVLVTLFVVLLGLVLSDSFHSKLSGINSIGTAQAIQIINQRKGLFLDVRDSAEFSKEHIADSENMPISSLADSLSKLKDPAQPIILVCASGQRARGAAKQLRSKEFSEVYVLSGGLNAWREAKLPLFS
ncbi:MAG: sulfurtransferase [Methylophaga sp.]|nr:MAG: sulfurtransferase [Methylophaga sp.]